MPNRNLTLIRRHINRLLELIRQKGALYPVLQILTPLVESAVQSVNDAWQKYQQAAVIGTKERSERDSAAGVLLKWIQQWRPLVLLFVPGAEANIHKFPSTGGTVDDSIRIAEDLQSMIMNNPAAASLKEAALAELGEKLANAKKETREAVDALPLENAAREAYTEACLRANEVLVRALDTIRSLFGPTSAEYRQFSLRSRGKEEAEEDAEEESAPTGA